METSGYDWIPTAATDLKRLAEALQRAGYGQQAVLNALKPEGQTLTADRLAVHRRLNGADPLAGLISLFVLGDVIPLAQARTALSGPVVDRLLGTLLVPAGTGGVRSRLKLVPSHDWYLAADFMPEVTGQPLVADCVMGVGTASITLADLTVRQRVGTALDLGTGGGIQALFASRHAGHVVATDLNPRALAIARFNATLNGVESLEFRQGSFYEPVASDTFDLLVANPPFVISPGADYTFRDGGLQGDGVSERVIRQAGCHLAANGFATILLNWYHSGDDDWAARPLAWAAESGCEAWLLCFETGDPLDYALRWLRDSEGGDDARVEPKLDTWLRYYESIQARRISAGALILRQAAGRTPWNRADHIAGVTRRGACGEQIVRVFEAETFLRSLPEAAALAGHSLRLCGQHEVNQVIRLADSRWALHEQTLRPLQGINLAGRIDGTILALLERCDGTRSLRSLLREVTGEATAEGEQAFTAIAARLLRAGILIPPARPTASG